MTPPDPDFGQYSILVFCVGLFAVLGAVASVSAIWKNIVLARAARNPERTPPLGEEAAKVYATKAELQQFRAEWATACKRNHDKIDDQLKEIYNLLRQQKTEMSDKLDAYHEQIAEWQLGVERQIGKLDERTQR